MKHLWYNRLSVFLSFWIAGSDYRWESGPEYILSSMYIREVIFCGIQGLEAEDTNMHMM